MNKCFKIGKHGGAGVMSAALLAGILLTGCTADVTVDERGNYIADGSAVCLVEEHDISYTVKLKVKTDADGNILSVEDAGTEVPDGKNGLYITAQSLFGELKGKNRDMLKDVDAVSSATCSSKAIIAAAEDALKNIDKEKEDG